jgi:hypothetical protein
MDDEHGNAVGVARLLVIDLVTATDGHSRLHVRLDRRIEPYAIATIIPGVHPSDVSITCIPSD